MIRILFFALLLSVGMTPMTALQAQSKQPNVQSLVDAGATAKVYKKTVDSKDQPVELKLYVFQPRDHRPSDRRPAIVFFFGGGWRNGSPAQFRQHCIDLAQKGMVAITADYRVSSRQGTKVTHCVADAKSAIRWVRRHANELGIHPDQVVAAGGSAGGHLAASTGVVPGFDSDSSVKDGDDPISSVPNALALFNPALVLWQIEGQPALDQTRLNSLKQRIGDAPVKVSPYHHVKPGAPPTIIFHGTADKTVPYRTAAAFAEKMKRAGNRCELKSYPDQGHGFFNHGRKGNNYAKTIQQLETFLVSLKFISPSNTP